MIYSRVLSLDPGTRRTGIAIVDLTDKGIIVPFAETFNVDKSLRWYQDVLEFQNETMARSVSITNQVMNLVNHYKPDRVATESPFMGSFAQTFGVLTSLLGHIDQRMRLEYPILAMERYSPTEVKRFMGVKGNSGDKTLMAKALASCPISYSQHLQPVSFDEHTVDAICVGLYAHHQPI